jgi:class 3 adenylate cyclase/tetratricopeptide (TPR) repeat protein
LLLHTYLPQDRLRAIANNASLLDRISGSALFADISGFTALTESLRVRLGARQGAEELSKQLEKVYSALIAEIEQYGGSVIGFAGDAMMCWFDVSRDKGQGSGVSAVSCAFALQDAIQEFPELALKVAIASGEARRFVVGNPDIQRIDTLAGATVARTATGEHLANKGDVLVDEGTMNSLAETIKIIEWREDGSEKFAVVTQASADRERGSVNAEPQSVTPMLQALRPYVHHAVYERETSGQGSFLTEFRPCVALFIRFTGIDYDSDSAESELDAFIREVQHTVSRHDGTLLDITIGDKGSYAYVSFGVLSVHEDDSRRAVKSALELRNRTELQLQMGITQGLMRVGAYGGETRKVFGALGDDVNLAARLMMSAKENEILLSSHVHKAVIDQFTFEPRPPVPMKGKAEPLPVFAVTGERQQRAVRLQEPAYALPMVGRQSELTLIEEKLDLAASGQAQVIGIVAEAGLGKSRLVAEVIRSAHRKGFVGYGGTCQSDGIHTPYLAWKSIWQAFFDVDPSAPLRKKIRDLEREIADQAPESLEALPLLGTLLNLEIPDNEFTQTLEPQSRQSVLRVLLADCLSAAARDEPLLIVVEDLHWIDALSHDLLEQLARALQDSPICFVLAYRPPQLMRLQAPQLEAMLCFTKVELAELNLAEGEQAIRAKLAQLYPSRMGTISPLLVETLMLRSQGNPFYLEELLNYVRDRGLDPANLEQIALPDSLHTLVLSRIDQLSEYEKTTLRAACIVGRLFRASWLTGYYPELGPFPKVKAALNELDALDITPLDSEPESTYLFKHIITHEVTYESLPFATRARLHEQLALYLEHIGAPVDMIAQHYGRSHNEAKQREYWQKAGDAAREAFANEAALDYYSRLQPLLTTPREQGSLHLKQAEVSFSWGRVAEARQHMTLGLNLIGHPLPQTTWQWLMGVTAEIGKQVWYRLANKTDLNRTELITEPNRAALELARACEVLGNTDLQSNQISILRIFYLVTRALNLAESVPQKSPTLARAISNSGVLLSASPPMRGLARHYFERARTVMADLNHPPTSVVVLWCIGVCAYPLGKWEEAEKALQQALEISARLGGNPHRVFAFYNLGFIAYLRGHFNLSLELYTVSYNEGQSTNNLERQVAALNGQALNLFRKGQIAQVILLLNKAFPLFETVPDSSVIEAISHGMMAVIHLQQGQLAQARQSATSVHRLLSLTSLPNPIALDAYRQVAYVYLELWEKSQTQSEKAQLQLLARQACRSLNQYKFYWPIGQPSAWRMQGRYDWQAGKRARARQAWQKSLLAAQKLTMPYDEALAYYEIGRHATGEEREANSARANEIFERLGVDVQAISHV